MNNIKENEFKKFKQKKKQKKNPQPDNLSKFQGENKIKVYNEPII